MKKIIWITGASSGLGRELALEAGRKGMHVVLLARNEERLASVQKKIIESGGTAQFFLIDVSEVKEIERDVPEILAEVGGIDVLINNAGFGVFEEVDRTSMDTVRDMFHVNVIGLIALTKLIVSYMIKNHGGHIINISSQAGKVATPKSAIYSATKHAVLGFTNGLRLELEKTNIYVSSVNPGPIKTPFFERADKSGSYVNSIERWMLKPEQVAKATINLIDHPKRELNLPRWMALSTKVYQLMPQLFERIAKKQFQKK